MKKERCEKGDWVVRSAEHAGGNSLINFHNRFSRAARIHFTLPFRCSPTRALSPARIWLCTRVCFAVEEALFGSCIIIKAVARRGESPGWIWSRCCRLVARFGEAVSQGPGSNWQCNLFQPCSVTEKPNPKHTPLAVSLFELGSVSRSLPDSPYSSFVVSLFYLGKWAF